MVHLRMHREVKGLGVAGTEPRALLGEMQATQYTAAAAWPTFFKTLSEKGHEGEGVATRRRDLKMRRDVNNSDD